MNMQLSLIVCLFLSVSVVVYGSVTIRNIRSEELEQDVPSDDGSVLFGRRHSGATSRRHPIRGYNRTGTYGFRDSARVPLPSLSCNQTRGLPMNPYPTYGNSGEDHVTPINLNSQSGVGEASETNPTSDGTNMIESNIDVRSGS